MKSTSKMLVRDVFFSLGYTKENFYKRKEIEQELTKLILAEGKNIIISGKSGIGKSSLLLDCLNKLEIKRFEPDSLTGNRSYIFTHCQKKWTVDALLENIFQQLASRNDFSYTSNTSIEKSRNLSGSMKVASGGFSNKHKQFAEVKEEPLAIVKPNYLTLASELSKNNVIWIIENVEQLENDQVEELLNILEFFSDLLTNFGNLKILILDRFAKIYHIAKSNRCAATLATVVVPELKITEIEAVVDNGFKKLGILLDSNSINLIMGMVGDNIKSAHELCNRICNGLLSNNTETFLTGTIFQTIISFIKLEHEDFQMKFRNNNLDKIGKCIIWILIKAEESSLSLADIHSRLESVGIQINLHELQTQLTVLHSKEGYFLLNYDRFGRKYSIPQSCFKNSIQQRIMSKGITLEKFLANSQTIMKLDGSFPKDEFRKDKE